MLQLHIESQRLDWGWSIEIWGNGGDFLDIHRRERLTWELLTAGKERTGEASRVWPGLQAITRVEQRLRITKDRSSSRQRRWQFSF
jgi:hypothetical protein